MRKELLDFLLETGSLSPRQLNSQETPLVWDLVEAIFLEALLFLDKESSSKISFCIFFSSPELFN